MFGDAASPPEELADGLHGAARAQGWCCRRWAGVWRALALTLGTASRGVRAQAAGASLALPRAAQRVLCSNSGPRTAVSSLCATSLAGAKRSRLSII